MSVGTGPASGSWDEEYGLGVEPATRRCGVVGTKEVGLEQEGLGHDPPTGPPHPEPGRDPTRSSEPDVHGRSVCHDSPREDVSPPSRASPPHS